MRRFLYLRDPLFLVGCAAYAINRWLVKPHYPSGFFHGTFNDLWLIPCALPPILWLQRKLGARNHDLPPTMREVVFHLVFWSVLCEWIGPYLSSRATGDPDDVFAYAIGAMLAFCWWRKEEFQILKRRNEL